MKNGNQKPAKADRWSRVKTRLKSLGKGTWITIASLAVILIGLRLAMPSLVHRYVNHTLNKIPGYQGQVGDITISLWRGAYAIKDLKLLKKNGKVPVPFVDAKKLEFSVQWRELFHGALVAEIVVVRPSLNFVAGKSEQTRQTGIDKSWTKRLKELFPLTINSFRIYDGEVHYRDFHSNPQVDLFMRKLNVEAHNFTNVQKEGKDLLAHIYASGEPMPGAFFRMRADVDPFALQPKFKVAFALTRVQLTQINNFLKAYAKVDAESGEFSLFGELAAAEGSINGYVKPLLDRPRFLSMEDIKEESFPKALWESVVAAIAALFKNQPKDRLATEVPVSGKFDQPNPDTLATIFNLLRNAFIQAIVPGFEGSSKVAQTGKSSKWEKADEDAGDKWTPIDIRNLGSDKPSRSRK